MKTTKGARDTRMDGGLVSLMRRAVACVVACATLGSVAFVGTTAFAETVVGSANVDAANSGITIDDGANTGDDATVQTIDDTTDDAANGATDTVADGTTGDTDATDGSSDDATGTTDGSQTADMTLTTPGASGDDVQEVTDDTGSGAADTVVLEIASRYFLQIGLGSTGSSAGITGPSFEQVAAASSAATDPSGASVGEGVQFVLWPEYYDADTDRWLFYGVESRQWYQSTFDGSSGDAWIAVADNDLPAAFDWDNWSPMPNGCLDTDKVVTDKVGNKIPYCTANQLTESQGASFGSDGETTPVLLSVDGSTGAVFKYHVTMTRPSIAVEEKYGVFFSRANTEVVFDAYRSGNTGEENWTIAANSRLVTNQWGGRTYKFGRSSTTNQLQSTRTVTPEGTGPTMYYQVSDIEEASFHANKVIVHNEESEAEDYAVLMTPDDISERCEAIVDEDDGTTVQYCNGETSREETPMPDRQFKYTHVDSEDEPSSTADREWYGPLSKSVSFSKNDKESYAAALRIDYVTRDINSEGKAGSIRWFKYTLCEQGPNGGCATAEDNAQRREEDKTLYDLSQYTMWVRGEIKSDYTIDITTEIYLVQDYNGNNLIIDDKTPLGVKQESLDSITFVNPRDGKFSFTKTDKNGNGLAGAEFEITSSGTHELWVKPADGNNVNLDKGLYGDGNYEYTSKDDPKATQTLVAGSEGKVSISKIYLAEAMGYVEYKEYNDITYAVVNPNGGSETETYTITETKAPEGYTLDGKNPAFSVTFNKNGTVLFEKNQDWNLVLFNGRDVPSCTTQADGTGCDVTVTNVPNGIAFLKTDTSGNALAGAEFKITKDGPPFNVVPTSDSLDGELSGAMVAGRYRAAADGEGGSSTVVSGDDGYVYISTLPDGMYRIEETKAPDDFIQPAEGEIVFTVTIKDGKIVERERDGATASALQSNVANAIADTEPGVNAGCDMQNTPAGAVYTCVATVINKRPSVSALPKTGGSGMADSWMLTAGLAAVTLLVIGAAAMVKRRSLSI